MKTNLKNVREELGLKQQQVADMINTYLDKTPGLKKNNDEIVIQQTIQRLESGKINMSLNWILRLTGTLKISASRLVPDLATEYEQEEKLLIDKINTLKEEEKEMLGTFVDSLLQKKEKKS